MTLIRDAAVWSLWTSADKLFGSTQLASTRHSTAETQLAWHTHSDNTKPKPDNTQDTLCNYSKDITTNKYVKVFSGIDGTKTPRLSWHLNFWRRSLTFSRERADLIMCKYINVSGLRRGRGQVFENHGRRILPCVSSPRRGWAFNHVKISSIVRSAEPWNWPTAALSGVRQLIIHSD